MVTLDQLDARIQQLEVQAAADFSKTSTWEGTHRLLALALAMGFGFLLGQIIHVI